jgi:hypothetical protein
MKMKPTPEEQVLARLLRAEARRANQDATREADLPPAWVTRIAANWAVAPAATLWPGGLLLWRMSLGCVALAVLVVGLSFALMPPSGDAGAADLVFFLP